jgi:hypothetical protein
MTQLTTVKVNQDTLRWINRLKSASEYLFGHKNTLDEIIYWAVTSTDYNTAVSWGITQKEYNDYVDEIEKSLDITRERKKEINQPEVIDPELGRWKCPQCHNWNPITPAWEEDTGCEKCDYKRR